MKYRIIERNKLYVIQESRSNNIWRDIPKECGVYNTFENAKEFLDKWSNYHYPKSLYEIEI